MNQEQPDTLQPNPGPETPPSGDVHPRIWPAVVIAALQLSVAVGTSVFAPETPIQFIGMMFAPVIGAVLFLLWWLLASRVPVRERLVGLLLGTTMLASAYLLSDGSMEIVFAAYGLVTLLSLLGLVVVATATIHWSRRRWFPLLAVAGLSVLIPTLRVDGLSGSFIPEFSFRWSPTSEDELVASAPAHGVATDAATPPPLRMQTGDWPGFRGPERDGVVRGVTFSTDWSTNAPRELWRRPVGPGWSSFAVIGDLVFTQEQRGAEELVTCYGLESGDEVWVNRVVARFEETIGGPGPRATPTFHEGRLYTLGAKGALQCIDPATGESLWRRELVTDSGADVPMWGFSSSPLVIGELVVVFCGKGDGKSVLAYDGSSGDLRWSAGDGTLSYSSCHAARLAGVDQVQMVTDVGLQAFVPETGRLLWEHRWPLEEMTRVVQPLVLGESAVLLGTSFGLGTRRLDVRRTDGRWVVETRWTSRALKPYFNDFVHHRGHGYGFDARIFACFDVETGSRRWKGGRYGHGQVVLVEDPEVLLVVTEEGEVVLVAASSERHHELARRTALSGKTWNHPVIAHGRLLVRNGHEIACYALPQ